MVSRTLKLTNQYHVLSVDSLVCQAIDVIFNFSILSTKLSHSLVVFNRIQIVSLSYIYIYKKKTTTSDCIRHRTDVDNFIERVTERKYWPRFSSTVKLHFLSPFNLRRDSFANCNLSSDFCAYTFIIYF